MFLNLNLRLIVFLISPLIIIFSGESLLASQTTKDNNLQTVGLALSGGGAKGIAEIGVIQALEENDIPIDYITGTSMGAIVGGLYACGYTPDEMMELILSQGFSSWSTGKIEERDKFYFNNPVFTPDIISISLISHRDSTRSYLPSSLISPLPMNFAFMELFSAYTAQCGGDFDKLFVPFRCVTSDVYEKHKVVMRKGHLGDAIRASMSFPTVFQPIEIDGFLAFDGGLYDNFPVDVMEDDFVPDIILGADVSGPNTRPPQYDLFQQLEDMIMQKSNYDVPAEKGIRIKIDTHGVTLLQFPKAREIYKMGYDKAMEMMDSIKLRVTSRISAEERAMRRNTFKRITPSVRFRDVMVKGGSLSQNNYIKYLFTGKKNRTFDLSEARESYYRAVTTGRFRNLEPTANLVDTTGLFDLNLKATVRDNINLGLGGFLTSSVNSMVYLSAGYSTLSLHSLEAHIRGWLGQSYMAAEAVGRLFFPTTVPSSLTLQGVISRTRFHDNDKLFFEDREPVFITNLNAFGQVSYNLALRRTGNLNFLVAGGIIRDKYNITGNDLDIGYGNNIIKQYIGRIGIDATFYTLNNKMFPTAGHKYNFSLSGILGKYDIFFPNEERTGVSSRIKWIQLEINAQKYWNISKYFSFGLEGNLLASTRKLMPDYNSTLVSAYAFNPTPASHNSFHPTLRALSYCTAGIIPILKFNENLQLRTEAHYFIPFRAIDRVGVNMVEYGKWFGNPKLFAEASIAYNFPFASLSGYVNYINTPGRKWNIGLSFGLFFLAPRLL